MLNVSFHQVYMTTLILLWMFLDAVQLFEIQRFQFERSKHFPIWYDFFCYSNEQIMTQAQFIYNSILSCIWTCIVAFYTHGLPSLQDYVKPEVESDDDYVEPSENTECKSCTDEGTSEAVHVEMKQNYRLF